MTAAEAAAEPSGSVRGRRGRARPDLAVLRPGRHLRALEAPADVDGPRVRLGLLWALATFVFISVGASALALWMALVAAAAAAQTARSWRQRERQPLIPLAALTALVLPLGAGVGWGVAVGLAVLAAAATVAAGRTGAVAAPGLTLAIGVGLGLAGSALVLARSMGFVEAVVLFGLIAIYDASAFLVGSGATNPWEGPAAGIAAIGAFSLAVAAVFASPFAGASPWILGLLAAILAPLGPFAATALLGDRRRRAPALRRLDSLLLLGPAWVALAALLLD